eukprot:301607_1
MSLSNVLLEEQNTEINDTFIIEEEKYSSSEFQKIEPHANLHSNLKTMRSLKQIKSYLRTYIPPYIEHTALLKPFVFVFIPLILNVYFIVSNFLIFDSHRKESDQQYRLWISKYIVTYFEFIILLLLFFYYTSISVYNYMSNESLSTIVDGILTIKSFSAFKVFYKCRPTAVFEYLFMCYKHQNAVTNKETKYNRLQYLMSELQKEVRNPNVEVNNMMKSQMIDTSHKLSEQIKHMKMKDKPVSEDKQNILSTIENHSWSVSQICTFSTWIILIIVCLLLLCVGILSLLLKLSQFSFLNDDKISGYQIYFTVAFCNQLWNISNENEIRIDTIYKCLFLDSIKCNYTPSVAEKVNHIDSVMKSYLFKHHHFKGFLLSLQINWKFVFKLVFQDSIDICPISDCQIYNDMWTKLTDIESSKMFTSLQLYKLKMQIPTLQNIKQNLSLQSEWKPLHPYTHIKLELQQQPKIKYSDWMSDPLTVFVLIQKAIMFGLPVSYVMSIVLSILILIFQYQEINTINSTEECKGVEIYIICYFCSGIISLLLWFMKTWMCIKMCENNYFCFL